MCERKGHLSVCRHVRIEIPLHIVPSSHISNACLDALVQLPQILCQEEQDMFSLTKRVPGLDLLTKMHNSAGKWCHSFTRYQMFLIAVDTRTENQI